MAIDELHVARRPIAGLHLRRRFKQRNLSSLAPADRILAWALIGTAALAMCVITLALFGIGPLSYPTAQRLHAATGTTIFGGLTLVVAVLAGTVRPPVADHGTLGKLAIRGVRPIPSLGLMTVAFTILAMDEGQRTSTYPEWIVIRAILWISLGISAVYVLRPRLGYPEALLDGKRAFRVIFPAILFLMVLNLASRPLEINALLVPTLTVAGIVGFGLIVGVSVSLALAGLETTRAHGETIARYVHARKRLILVSVIGKLAALLLVWAAFWILLPSETVFAVSAPTWVMAGIAGLVVVVLFAVDSRIRLSSADHSMVTRYLGIIAGAAFGLGLGAVTVVAMMATVVTARWATILGVTVLVGFGFLQARSRRRGMALAAYPIAFALAIATSILVGSGHRLAKPVVDMKNANTVHVLTLWASTGVFFVFVGCAVWIVTAAIRSRKFGWLTYVVTVFVWYVVMTVWTDIVTVKFMNFDLVLTLLLGVASILLILGFQRVIDGFEIVAVLSVTFLLIEGPMIADLLPHQLQVIPVLIALLGPGLTALWRESAAVNDPLAQRRAIVRIATTTLVYLQIASILWIFDLDIPTFIQTFTTFAVSFLSIPLLLLLVAAHNPQRHNVAAG